MLTKEGQSRTARENIVLAFALATAAGAVNAIGLQELAAFTSNMSGNVTRLAEALGKADATGVWFYAPLVAAFVTGAMTATAFVERAKLLGKARYVAALLVEVFLLAAFTLTTELVPEARHPWLATALRVCLAFSMGLQNALVTKISGAVVRTTHVSGMLTDFSIECVRLFFWFRERTRGRNALERLWELSRIARDTELDRLKLHLTILLSFLSSAAAATALYLHVTRRAMLMPLAVLVTLIVYDRARKSWAGAPTREVNANVAGSLEPPR